MNEAAPDGSRLPQLQGRPMVTDGGIETDLIYHHGADLPCFAAFPLLGSAAGRALLQGYYDGYAAIARAAGAGLLLESPTWRASPWWGEQLGYSAADLARVNASAIELLARLREGYQAGIADIVLSGMVGPKADSYPPGGHPGPDEAADYHRPQIEAFAQAGADMVTALTLTSTDEAIGIVRAARAAGLPVAISFPVETDGRLAGGMPLGEAVTGVDTDAAPDYFGVNCAHPTHIRPALTGSGNWRERIRSLRYNASASSHAELDEAGGLDEGDPQLLAADHARLSPLLPQVPVLGGCCGTDARHVVALWSTSGQAGA